ncbi:hypothetical protein D7V94_20295 [Parablautia intestinalis]|uniref:Uncharacterized protein n=1 Tax=Parablautia intestinalis TaxID=2320100 RepID=A0A3A9ANL2_9FIRM|nr:hypothetical protein [Parablautia intestinalis]RKI87905.1 hypothetical protein D7V94_20295 [Parablautia intestinalis]
MDNIYKALGYLKTEEQGIIISNYKLTELHSIFANDEAYEKYINDLFAVSNEFTKRAIALLSLHTEAFLQSRKKQEFDPATDMCQIYNGMSEADQKRFCQNMFAKKKFFEDACVRIMDSFNQAVEVKGDDVGSDITNDVVNAKMEK